MASKSRRTIKFIIDCLIVGLGILSVLYSVLILTSPTYWFEYKAIIPTQTGYHVGEEVYFRSYSRIERDVPISYNDTLFCEFGNWYGIYDSVPSNRPWGKGMNYFDKGTPPRRRAGDLPARKTTCLLHSTITAYVWFWVIKRQNINSSTFDIY